MIDIFKKTYSLFFYWRLDSSMKSQQTYSVINGNNGTSSDIDLIDLHKSDDVYKQCLLCKEYFEDLKRTNLCAKCNDQKLYGNPLPVRRYDLSTPISVQPTTNNNRFVRNSDFVSPRVSSIGNNNRIFCRNCGHLNLLLTKPTYNTRRCSNCSCDLRQR